LSEYNYTPEDDAALKRIRKEIRRRIEGALNGFQARRYSPADEHSDRGTVPTHNFNENGIIPTRSPRSQFAVPLTLIIVADKSGAWKASHEESMAILSNEDRWNDAMPVWAKNFVPTFSYEDDILLKEMQLFTGGDNGLRN
jgi:hypothetical protein